MIFDSFLTTIFYWVVNLSYVVAILPQVFLNYKIKSTKGLSDFYLMGYFAGYATNFLYVYSLDFHLAYKVRAILAVFVILIMFFQRFSYESSILSPRIKRLYFSDIIFFLFLFPLVFFYPKELGNFTGWALLLIWTLYQVPQIMKIYKNKSVEGFSFILVSLIGIGNVIDFFLAYILNLPIQTYFIALRGIIIYFIFCFQFWLYRS